MANRFVQAIRAGSIGSVEELKSEFKALAKQTHPDLHGSDSHAEFVRVRDEYEAALRDFDRHRFGGPAGTARAGREPFDRRATYAELAILLKRGFPKRPRHEKEAQRYEYCRHLLRSRLVAWGGLRAEAFDAFERELLAARGADKGAVDWVLDMVLGILEYHATGIEAARAAIELGLASLRAEPGSGGAVTDFLGMLVEDMAAGPALRGRD